MKVSVTTGCRLHLGFTNLSEDVGRCFGSIGVALEWPRDIVVLDDHGVPGIVADDPEHVEAWIRRFSDYYSVKPSVSVEVRESIPEHVGLGSGTQLALAIGMGLATVCGIDADARDVAVAMGRGGRSGVGIATFEAGGFIIDAGRKKRPSSSRAAPVVTWRREFPPDWSFVVVIPEVRRGLSGRSEEEVFETLSPSVRISEEICRLTQLRLMPALAETDIEEFGAALLAIDQKTGLYFSDVQGGIYAATEANETIRAMMRAGAFGAGQSSWGPAVYALVDEASGGNVAGEVRKFMEAKGWGGSVFECHGRNVGAQVEVQRDAL